MAKKKHVRCRKYEGRPASQSMAEAFAKTTDGKALVAEARKRESDIRFRVRELKEITYRTFVTNVPGWLRHKLRRQGHNTRDVYRDPAVRERIRELGREGGEAYENAVRTLKFTWDSKRSYEDSLAILKPSN